jgi:hypothetical protein|mmetsp:Transcript_6299/g.9745  ORF Transcript_6299/g.9745 Transcript_6299/m.9745 type:complete len:216 (-) Transcript_6299:690-1337(-)
MTRRNCSGVQLQQCCTRELQVELQGGKRGSSCCSPYWSLLSGGLKEQTTASPGMRHPDMPSRPSAGGLSAQQFQGCSTEPRMDKDMQRSRLGAWTILIARSFEKHTTETRAVVPLQHRQSCLVPRAVLNGTSTQRRPKPGTSHVVSVDNQLPSVDHQQPVDRRCGVQPKSVRHIIKNKTHFSRTAMRRVGCALFCNCGQRDRAYLERGLPFNRKH